MRRLSFFALCAFAVASLGGCDVLAPVSPVTLSLHGPTDALARWQEGAPSGWRCEYDLVIRGRGGASRTSAAFLEAGEMTLYDADTKEPMGTTRFAYNEGMSLLFPQSVAPGEEKPARVVTRAARRPYLWTFTLFYTDPESDLASRASISGRCS